MADRVNRIKTLIDKIIRDTMMFKVKDPNLGIVFINEVVVNNDFSFAKVFVTFADKKNKEKKLKILDKVKGLFRSELARNLDIRKIPQVAFYYDETYDNYDRIEALIKKEQKELDEMKKK